MGTTPRAPDESGTVTVFESDGLIVARDEETGVASQGDTKPEALANLAEALDLHSRPAPDNEDFQEPDAPWFDD
ncbi:type II toxin-antitoxin system HicB family antitoxin [Halorientalis pallida]|uniref:Type II toxin-antitoxin system HicB family antitoxin n=1 Tax=Halorientalis pallida TaxID=2479928 RepID=A0A498L793_9EURY|nr:type II toxin-antitoxin system HicB family antitoxin [Halorientalis pallida]